MADLEFPNGALVTGLELAFGADIYGDQDAWSWTDLTPLFMSQEVTTTRGRADESSDVSPTSADMEVDNPDGDLTPDNPMSIYWPNVDLGTPARWWIEALNTRLYLQPQDISSAEIASSAAIDILGDLDVRIDMHLKTMDPSGDPVVIMGRAETGSNFSWRVEVFPDRTVRLSWTSTGTVPVLTATSTTPVVPMSSRFVLRVVMDINNGAGGRNILFYSGETLTGPFTQIGPTVTQAGTTSIANVGEPLVIGYSTELPLSQSPDMDVYGFRLLDGVGGLLVMADFTTYDGVPPFVDSTGHTWTLFGAAELTSRWFRIVGTTDSWKPVWPWGDLSSQIPGGLTEGQARVALEIAGILRRLGQGASPLQSPLRRFGSAAANLRASWPMEDEDGSTQIASALEAGSPMSVAGIVDFASDSSLPGSGPLPELSATSSLHGSVTGSFSGHWRVDWYVNIPSPTPGQITIMRVTGTGTVLTWLVSTNAGSVTVTGINDLGGTVFTSTTTGTDFFDRWVNVQLIAEQDGINVDWSLTWFPVQFPPHAGVTFSGTYGGAVGDVTALAFPPDVDAEGMATGHWSVLDEGGTAVSTNAAMGWTGDTAVERMTRLCAEQGISFRVIGEPSTTAQVGIQQVATLLTLLDDAKEADGGILYEQPDRVGLIYRTRESMYNQPPNMILDAHQQQIQNPFAPVLDDQRTRNSIIVTRRGGSSTPPIEDAASIAKRGIYDDSVTLNLFADTQIQDAAGWLLHQGTIPGMRYAQMTTNLGVAPEMIDDWLTVDAGAQVHAINLPPQHPTETVKVVVEGYGEPISPTSWVPTMNCSPAAAWDVAVIDGTGVDDQYLLRLESDGSELTFDVTDTDTTFIVTVTDGPPWTSDNAETPFDIRINGERVTVTDIDAPVGGSEFTGAGDFEDVTPTTSFVAPSVVAPAAGDLLICAWCSYQTPSTYTLPGGMTIVVRTDGDFSSFEDATEVLGAPGATGTRTATYGVSDVWSAMSIVAHSALGTPGIQEVVSGVDDEDVTLVTSTSAAIGDWLLALQGWDWDPGDNMGPPSGDGWAAVADSMAANEDTSRVRAWAKRVTEPGIQSATFSIVGGISDNHARLYILNDVTGVTQEFTVVRSVNSVVRAHPAATPFELWFQPVLAR